MSVFNNSDPLAPKSMREHKERKVEAAKERQMAAILSAHPNGICDCKSKKPQGVVGAHSVKTGAL